MAQTCATLRCLLQVTHKIQSPWALPAVLLAMPALFFAILYGPAHSNLAAARAESWVQNQVRPCIGMACVSATCTMPVTHAIVDRFVCQTHH